MTLPELFAPSFTGRRDSIALEFHGATFTFGDLDHRSNILAHALQARGLQPGDRVSVYLANSVEIILVYLACIKLGLIFVPINILYRDREITHILNDAQPALSINDASEITALINSSPASAQLPQLTSDTPAGIIYTSGTTGTSKGAVLTHNNFAINATALLDAWRITSDDRLLLPLPLFHVHGLGNGLHCWLASGCRMRLLDRFDHHSIAQEFLDFRPTLFFGVPAMYVRLLEIPSHQAREIGATMRLFVSGSAPLSTQTFDEFRSKFGHAILERYGMSETLMIIGNPYDGERRPGTVGLPFPHVDVRFLDEAGEIYLKGPNIFAGYWRNEEATRAAFRDGYFRTGDLAVRSPDGYYTLCGRKSDLVISGGFNIYPREIEEFLEEQDGIAEAAVAAVPDRVRGEVPIAFIVTTRPVNLADLEARCRAKLASFKIPRSFTVVQKLPRNALGKIQKHLLPKILPYEERPPLYAPYDSRAPQVAAILAQLIQGREPRVKVEHVGSTSIPGCSGKGIIDLAITYSGANLEHARAALDSLGFQRQTGRDPFPESRPMRIASIAALGGTFRIHAHVVLENSRDHLDLTEFRDALCRDPALIAAYEQAKQSILSSGVTDSLDYCNLKSEFVAATLSRLSHPVK